MLINLVYITDVKRLIGSRFHDTQVQKDMNSWPFKIVEGPAEKPTVVVELKGEEKKYAPEELSAMVLKKLKECAEEFIGREATKEAGTLAGLNVLRLINEPTAAAIAYGLDHIIDERWRNDKIVLVFDLGGGTFDVSLLKIRKPGVIDVKAVGGDTHLGGEDFDTTLVNYCVNEFKKKHREDLRRNPRAMGRLKVACEKAKRDLSSSIFALVEIDYLYEGIDFSIKVSRAKFEELNASYFEKCIQLVEKCLFDGEIKKKDVDEVVVVGGSTRIPKVQRLVEEFFDGKKACKNMNGDEAVAFGAALLASRLSGNDDDDNVVCDIVLQDVTPLSLGISVRKMVGARQERGRMDVIIPRNTSIPISKKKLYEHEYTSVTISVYQGESNEVKDNVLLGMFNLSGLTLAFNGESQLEVWFSIDSNGILHVSAQELSTGQRKSISIAKT
ncbi:putative Heat shock protein 70 family [Helianthus anomalus]